MICLSEAFLNYSIQTNNDRISIDGCNLIWASHPRDSKLSVFVSKETLNAFHDFKNKLKRVWSNVFRYVKVWIFWKYTQYAMHWDKAQMLKEISSEKINCIKNVLFFLSQV